MPLKHIFKLLCTFFVLCNLLFADINLTAYEGQQVSMSATVQGTSPFTYQWIKDNANITNAISSILDLGNITSSDSGSYAVKISNSAGFTVSNIATLAIVPSVNYSSFYTKSALSASISVPVNTFTTVVMAAIRNPNGYYDPSTGYYTVTESGTYRILIHARPTDMAPSGISWGLGAGSSNLDTPDFAWQSTNFINKDGDYQRNGAQNEIVKDFVVGDKIRMYLYATSTSGTINYLNFNGADMTITREY